MVMSAQRKALAIERVKNRAIEEAEKVIQSGMMKIYAIYPWKVAIRKDYLEGAVCYSIFIVDDGPFVESDIIHKKPLAHIFRFDDFPPSWRDEVKRIYTKTFENAIGYSFFDVRAVI